MSEAKTIFTVRCIFRHGSGPNDQLQWLYEERMTCWFANNQEEALELAAKEAVAYANLHSRGVECVGYQMGYSTDETQLKNGMEIFSLMRESNLNAEAYFDQFHDSGRERSRK